MAMDDEGRSVFTVTEDEYEALTKMGHEMPATRMLPDPETPDGHALDTLREIRGE